MCSEGGSQAHKDSRSVCLCLESSLEHRMYLGRRKRRGKLQHGEPCLPQSTPISQSLGLPQVPGAWDQLRLRKTQEFNEPLRRGARGGDTRPSGGPAGRRRGLPPALHARLAQTWDSRRGETGWAAGMAKGWSSPRRAMPAGGYSPPLHVWTCRRRRERKGKEVAKVGDGLCEPAPSSSSEEVSIATRRQPPRVL